MAVEDPERDELIRRFLPLAHKLARRYARGSEPLEDLEQAAAVGLIKAADRFEPERGHAFTSFAIPTILGELRRHFRDTAWCVRPTRAVQEMAARVARATDALTAELCRAPTTQEVAAELGCDAEAVIEARDALRQCNARSLDEPVPGDDAVTVGDAIGRVDDRYAFVDDALSVMPALAALPERERMILRMRYEDDLTQAQIAKRVGLSQMHVSRILRQSLDRAGAIAVGRARRKPEAIAA